MKLWIRFAASAGIDSFAYRDQLVEAFEEIRDELTMGSNPIPEAIENASGRDSDFLVNIQCFEVPDYGDEEFYTFAQELQQLLRGQLEDSDDLTVTYGPENHISVWWEVQPDVDTSAYYSGYEREDNYNEEF